MLFFCPAGTAAILCRRAALAVRTADAMGAGFFLFIDVADSQTDNNGNDSNYNNIITHRHYFFAFRAYSAAILASFFLITYTMNAAITATAAAPAIAAGMLRAAGSVSRVPMVYTR